MIIYAKFQTRLKGKTTLLLYFVVFLWVDVSIRCVEPGKRSTYKVTSAFVLAILFVILLIGKAIYSTIFYVSVNMSTE